MNFKSGFDYHLKRRSWSPKWPEYANAANSFGAAETRFGQRILCSREKLWKSVDLRQRRKAISNNSREFYKWKVMNGPIARWPEQGTVPNAGGGHENGGHMPAILDFIVIVKKFK